MAEHCHAGPEHKHFWSYIGSRVEQRIVDAPAGAITAEEAERYLSEVIIDDWCCAYCRTFDSTARTTNLDAR